MPRFASPRCRVASPVRGSRRFAVRRCVVVTDRTLAYNVIRCQPEDESKSLSEPLTCGFVSEGGGDGE